LQGLRGEQWRTSLNMEVGCIKRERKNEIFIPLNNADPLIITSRHHHHNSIRGAHGLVFCVGREFAGPAQRWPGGARLAGSAGRRLQRAQFFKHSPSPKRRQGAAGTGVNEEIRKKGRRCCRFAWIKVILQISSCSSWHPL
jgi:hypothetical protein